MNCRRSTKFGPVPPSKSSLRGMPFSALSQSRATQSVPSAVCLASTCKAKSRSGWLCNAERTFQPRRVQRHRRECNRHHKQACRSAELSSPSVSSRSCHNGNDRGSVLPMSKPNVSDPGRSIRRDRAAWRPISAPVHTSRAAMRRVGALARRAEDVAAGICFRNMTSSSRPATKHHNGESFRSSPF